MGTEDTSLHHNDLVAKVEADYIAKHKAGKSDEEALQEIFSKYKEENKDINSMYDFFNMLAEMMWKRREDGKNND